MTLTGTSYNSTTSRFSLLMNNSNHSNNTNNNNTMTSSPLSALSTNTTVTPSPSQSHPLSAVMMMTPPRRARNDDEEGDEGVEEEESAEEKKSPALSLPPRREVPSREVLDQNDERAHGKENKGEREHFDVSIRDSSTGADDAVDTVSIVSQQLTKRRELVKETIRTEEFYVRNLRLFVEVYAKQARRLVEKRSSFSDHGNTRNYHHHHHHHHSSVSSSSSSSNSSSNGSSNSSASNGSEQHRSSFGNVQQSSFTEAEYKCLFGNIKQILGANVYMLERLKQEVDLVGEGNEECCAIGKVFQEIGPFLKLYTDFVNNYDEAYALYKKLRSQKWFISYVQHCTTKLPPDLRNENTSLSSDLQTLLILPIQRIPRYQMLLQSILEVTDESMDDYPFVVRAVKLITESAIHCNNSKAASESLTVLTDIAQLLNKYQGITNFIQSHRRFVTSAYVNCSIMSSSLISPPSVVSPSRRTRSDSVSKLAIRPFGVKSPKPSKDRVVSPTEPFQGNCTAYLFNDVLVVLSDIVSDRSMLKNLKQNDAQRNIYVLYLQFCNLVAKPNSTTFRIESLADNKKLILLVRKMGSSELQSNELFFKFKDSIVECIEQNRLSYRKKYNVDSNTSLIETAKERQRLCEQRERAEDELRVFLASSLEMRRRKHKLNDDIVRKEKQLKTLQEEIIALKSSHDRCVHLDALLDNTINEQNDIVIDSQGNICQLDRELLKYLNYEVESFQKVLKSDPMCDDDDDDSLVGQGAQQPCDDGTSIYRGKKKRRRGSLSSVTINSKYDGDYSAFLVSPLFAGFEKHYGETIVVFSSMLHYILPSGASKECRLVITNSAVYLFNGSGASVRHRIAVESIMSLAVSNMNDNFFVIHCSDSHDFLMSSVKKTEILEIIQWVAQPKHSTGKQLEIQVMSSIVFLPTYKDDMITVSFVPKKSLQCEFSVEQSDTRRNYWTILYNPNMADTAFLSNKALLQQCVTSPRHTVSLKNSVEQIKTRDEDIYNGKKIRRRCSIDLEYRGFYQPINTLFSLQKLNRLEDLTLDDVRLCDKVIRYSSKLRPRRALLLITEASALLIDHKLNKIKSTIPFSDIHSITVSCLSDNFLGIGVRNGQDELIWSERKTEIARTLFQISNIQQITVLEESGSMSIEKGDKSYIGSIVPSFDSTPNVPPPIINELSFVTSNTFRISVPQQSTKYIIVGTMTVSMDGTHSPLVIFNRNDMTKLIPCFKLSNKHNHSFTAQISYYALRDIKAYHVEQKLSSTVTVITPMEDSTANNEQPYTIYLKKQTIKVSRLVNKKRIRTRILDHLGSDVGSFVFDVIFV